MGPRHLYEELTRHVDAPQRRVLRAIARKARRARQPREPKQERIRTCHWCKRRLTDAPAGGAQRPTDYTRDHIVPRALGGRQTVAACYRCNQVRHVEFLYLIGNESAAIAAARAIGLDVSRSPAHHGPDEAPDAGGAAGRAP